MANEAEREKAKGLPMSDIVAELEKSMQCNCALDKWEPERDTGHSWVCRIHKAAKERKGRREG